MGFCTKRHFLLSICFLQLISTVERQVFDFLGYMWIPILVNFFEIIFVIFGFFGTFQYRPKYVISYSVWNFVLLAWNIFLICLYLNVGILNHEESKVLKLDPDSWSWWKNNGPGCRTTFNTTASVPVVEAVSGCLLEYVHVEVGHAALQCILALLGCITGLCLSKTFLEEDDSFEFLDGNSKNPQQLALQPMYVSSGSIIGAGSPSSRSSVSSWGRRYATPDHLPLCTDSRPRHKPHRPRVHTDQIRQCATDPHSQRTKSYDRLVFDNGRLVNQSRPKSLYIDAFVE